MGEVISIENLSFDYPDKHDVLNNIALKVNTGESIGIIGPNGAGKTTLFHLLCGLLKPNFGKIMILRKEVAINSFNPDIGYIFQNPDDQLFNATVFEDVAFGPLNMNLAKEDVIKRALYALGVVDCTGLRDRSPHHLSGGEKRMIAIATIIAMKPKVVIYDEPTSNLDMRARRNIINFINSSKETKLIASHDLEFILETCSRVVMLDQGEIVSDGNSVDIMNNEEFMHRHGLEKPHSLFHIQMKHKH